MRHKFLLYEKINNTFQEKMGLGYISPFELEPDNIAWLLNEGCAELVEAQPGLWKPEKENGEEE